jgi:hypothetical protein
MLQNRERRLRASFLLSACAAIAASSGCAQVAGIEDISSSDAAQHCVDTVNQMRAAQKLSMVARWTDHEQCADQLGLAYANNPSSPLMPSCTGSTKWVVFGDSPVTDPDSFFQRWVQGHAGALEDPSIGHLACGYSATASDENGSFLAGP